MTEQTLNRYYWKKYHEKETKTVFDTYEKPTRHQLNLWKKASHECIQSRGFGLTVLDANEKTFTYGFLYTNIYNGHACFAYGTKSNIDFIDLTSYINR